MYAITIAAVLSLTLLFSRSKAFAPLHQMPTAKRQRASCSSLQAVSSRRDALLAAGAFSSFLLLPQQTARAEAVTASPTIGGINKQIANVEAWPGIENLEPMFELKLSIDAMTAGIVADSKNYPYIKKRLDKFFKGSILSEKNFYFGVGLQYMNDIKYTSGELPNYVVMDKQARYDALELTMKNLEGLKSVLGKDGADAGIIEGYAKDSQAALASWFAMIPTNELKAVEELFVHVKKADVNRDGRLSDDELASLSVEEQQVWKKRVDKFG